MSDQRFRGWRNYETWMVHRWIIADEYLFLNTLRIVESAGSTVELAQALKEQHQNLPSDRLTQELQIVDVDVIDWLQLPSRSS